MSYGNPVPGIIHPLGYFGANGELRPAGNTEFVVTRDCAGHRATNQGCALDLGNLRCDGKVFAVAAGRVQSRDNVQGIIRIDHADGSRSAYAHMLPILVSVGQTVTQGQQIGEVGDAHDPAILNFSGCHLHFAIQLTATGPEVDPWPLLAQNITGGDMLKGKVIAQIHNRQTTVLGDNTRFRPSPGTAEPELVMLPAGEGFIPYWLVEGGLALGSTRWYGTWKTTPKGIEFGYVSEKLVGPLTPIEATGFTQAQVDAAVNAAKNPIKDKVAALAADVAND